MNDYKKYLPSKKFTAIILFIVVLIVLFSLVKITIKFFKNRYEERHGPASMQITVESITQKDSNDNGIPDWEEYLWGLNPNANGRKNKEIISNKKNQLIQDGMIDISNSDPINNNDAINRQFFTALISLQQTGQINEESLNSLANALGDNISKNNIADIYEIKDIKIVDDSKVSREKYNKDLINTVSKYQNADIGNELTYISQGLLNNDYQAFYVTKSIADKYIEISKDLSKIEVPKSMFKVHLIVINDYYKIGKSINGLILMTNDPITGMNSLLSYKNYTEDLYNNLEKITEFLQ